MPSGSAKADIGSEALVGEPASPLETETTWGASERDEQIASRAAIDHHSMLGTCTGRAHSSVIVAWSTPRAARLAFGAYGDWLWCVLEIAAEDARVADPAAARDLRRDER